MADAHLDLNRLQFRDGRALDRMMQRAAHHGIVPMAATTDPWTEDRNRLAACLGRPCPQCVRQSHIAASAFSFITWDHSGIERPMLRCTAGTHTWHKPATAEDEILP